MCQKMTKGDFIPFILLKISASEVLSIKKLNLAHKVNILLKIKIQFTDNISIVNQDSKFMLINFFHWSHLYSLSASPADYYKTIKGRIFETTFKR